MLSRHIPRAHRLVLLLTLVVALVATGFGHRQPVAQAQMVQMALALGAAPSDLCGGAGGQGGHTGAPCLACQIAGAADLPPLARTLARAEGRRLADQPAPRVASAVLRVLDPGHGPQAPPVA